MPELKRPAGQQNEFFSSNTLTDNGTHPQLPQPKPLGRMRTPDAIAQEIGSIISGRKKPDGNADAKLAGLVREYESSAAGCRDKIRLFAQVEEYADKYGSILQTSAAEGENALVRQIEYLSQKEVYLGAGDKIKVLKNIGSKTAKKKKVGAAIQKAVGEQQAYLKEQVRLQALEAEKQTLELVRIRQSLPTPKNPEQVQYLEIFDDNAQKAEIIERLAKEKKIGSGALDLAQAYRQAAKLALFMYTDAAIPRPDEKKHYLDGTYVDSPAKQTCLFLNDALKSGRLSRSFAADFLEWKITATYDAISKLLNALDYGEGTRERYEKYGKGYLLEQLGLFKKDGDLGALNKLVLRLADFSNDLGLLNAEMYKKQERERKGSVPASLLGIPMSEGTREEVLDWGAEMLDVGVLAGAYFGRRFGGPAGALIGTVAEKGWFTYRAIEGYAQSKDVFSTGIFLTALWAGPMARLVPESSGAAQAFKGTLQTAGTAAGISMTYQLAPGIIIPASRMLELGISSEDLRTMTRNGVFAAAALRGNVGKQEAAEGIPLTSAQKELQKTSNAYQKNYERLKKALKKNKANPNVMEKDPGIDQMLKIVSKSLDQKALNYVVWHLKTSPDLSALSLNRVLGVYAGNRPDALKALKKRVRADAKAAKKKADDGISEPPKETAAQNTAGPNVASWPSSVQMGRKAGYEPVGGVAYKPKGLAPDVIEAVQKGLQMRKGQTGKNNGQTAQTSAPEAYVPFETKFGQLIQKAGQVKTYDELLAWTEEFNTTVQHLSPEQIKAIEKTVGPLELDVNGNAKDVQKICDALYKMQAQNLPNTRFVCLYRDGYFIQMGLKQMLNALAPGTETNANGFPFTRKAIQNGQWGDGFNYNTIDDLRNAALNRLHSDSGTHYMSAPAKCEIFFGIYSKEFAQAIENIPGFKDSVQKLYQSMKDAGLFRLDAQGKLMEGQEVVFYDSTYGNFPVFLKAVFEYGAKEMDGLKEGQFACKIFLEDVFSIQSFMPHLLISNGYLDAMGEKYAFSGDVNEVKGGQPVLTEQLVKEGLGTEEVRRPETPEEKETRIKSAIKFYMEYTVMIQEMVSRMALKGKPARASPNQPR